MKNAILTVVFLAILIAADASALFGQKNDIGALPEDATKAVQSANFSISPEPTIDLNIKMPKVEDDDGGDYEDELDD